MSMHGRNKEVMLGNGTTLYVDNSNYISICKGGNDVMVGTGALAIAFETWDDFVNAIDRSKAKWVNEHK